MDEMTYKRAEGMLLDYIAAHAMRRTPERLEVLHAVCSMEGLFSVEELKARMEQDGRFVVSKVTLFHTLEVLQAAGVVMKHNLHRAAQYECNLLRQPIVMQVCSLCGGVEARYDEVALSLLSVTGTKRFTVHQPVLYLHGVCRKCAQLQQKKDKKQSRKKK